MCRHLATQMKKMEAPEIQLAVLFAEASHRADKLQLAKQGAFWFSYSVSSPWIQVYIPGKQWLYASFDLKSRRWAFNIAPEKRMEIEEIIKKEFSLD
jgi:hypothetical protein